VLGVNLDLLEELVAEGLSSRAMAARLGCSQGRISYWLRKHSLKTAPYKSHGRCRLCSSRLRNKRSVYCNNVCQQEYQYQQYIREWLGGKVSGHRNNRQKQLSVHIRRWIFERADAKCEKCGWCEVNLVSNNTPLQVDHIDGNCLNTCSENLRLLCPNCHSLTPTWGALNPNVGRRRLGIY
jgi:hypothetical protein